MPPLETNAGEQANCPVGPVAQAFRADHPNCSPSRSAALQGARQNKEGRIRKQIQPNSNLPAFAGLLTGRGLNPLTNPGRASNPWQRSSPSEPGCGVAELPATQSRPTRPPCLLCKCERAIPTVTRKAHLDPVMAIGRRASMARVANGPGAPVDRTIPISPSLGSCASRSEERQRECPADEVAVARKSERR